MNKPLYSIKNTIKYHNHDEKDCIHIAYGIDNNYARCAATSIASICINNSTHNFSFYIMTTGLTNINSVKFEELAFEYSVNITIFEVDSECLHSLPTKAHLPLPMYFRFILPMILKDVKQLIYIDADIVCLNQADEVFNMDLQGNVIAAVPDLEKMGKKRNRILGLTNHIYFNSGFLVIDVKKWLEMDMLQKLTSCISKEPKKFQYPDQDALNLILDGKVLYLERRFNCIDITSMEKIDIIFFHFAAHPKPWTAAWNISNKKDDFNIDLYKYYESSTPWHGTPPSMPNNYKEMEIYAKCLKQHKRTKEAAQWYLRYLMAKFKYITSKKS